MTFLMRVPSRLLRVLSALAVLLPVTAAADALTMPEFLALQPKWETLVEKKEPLRVEGRLASSSPRLLRLLKCPLPFRPAEGEFRDLRRGTARVEVVGRLERRVGEITFLVTELKEPRSRKTSWPRGREASAFTPYRAVDQASSSRRTVTSSPTATSSTMRRAWK
jgi:hypothetical protein